MNRPQVQSKVVVVCRNNGHKPVYVPLWGCSTLEVPETVTYTGIVVKPDHWMKAEEFNMTTGLPNYPVRTINLKNVISINGADVKQIKDDDIKVVNIKGSKGNEYEVIVRNGTAESCTCPAFRYRGGRCKHLSMAK